MSKFLEMAAQQVGQTVAQKVSQNPQAAMLQQRQLARP